MKAWCAPPLVVLASSWNCSLRACSQSYRNAMSPVAATTSHEEIDPWASKVRNSTLRPSSSSPAGNWPESGRRPGLNRRSKVIFEKRPVGPRLDGRLAANSSSQGVAPAGVRLTSYWQDCCLPLSSTVTVTLSHQGTEISRAGDEVDAARAARTNASTVSLLRARSDA